MARCKKTLRGEAQESAGVRSGSASGAARCKETRIGKTQSAGVKSDWDDEDNISGSSGESDNESDDGRKVYIKMDEVSDKNGS